MKAMQRVALYPIPSPEENTTLAGITEEVITAFWNMDLYLINAWN